MTGLEETRRREARDVWTYRAARRNRWRADERPWSFFKFQTPIIDRPYQARGWDWRRGGRYERDTDKMLREVMNVGGTQAPAA